LKLTDVSEVRTASITRALNEDLIDAGRTAETLVNYNVTTRRYIPEESKLQNNTFL
jgi:hypothetical protein